MNSAQKLGFIPHVKDSVKIMDNETFINVFNKEFPEDFNKSQLVLDLSRIEENNAKYILSSELNELYKEVQNKCKDLKEKISKSIYKIETNISISNANPSSPKIKKRGSFEDISIIRRSSLKSILLENEEKLL